MVRLRVSQFYSSLNRMKIDLYSAGTCRAIGWFTNRTLPFRAIDVPVGVALLHHSTAGLILYDTGLHPRCLTGSHWSQWLAHQLIQFNTTSDTTVASWLARMGIQPADIRYIVLSHYHNDHMGGLLDFPDSQFVASRTEYERLMTMTPLQQSGVAFNAALLPPDFASRLLAVEDLPIVQHPELSSFSEVRQAFADVFLVNLPGHARVQQGIYLPNEAVFFVADAVWSAASLEGPGTEPPSVVRLIQENWLMYRKTIRQLRQFRSQKPTIRLIISHDPNSYKHTR